MVWLHYLKHYRTPRPRLGFRFLAIILQRGRTVCMIQLSQAVISTADLMVVGLLSSWWDVGRYGAPHRMVTALLTFGLIFQQAAFPTLSRLWRQTAQAGREALDSLVEVLVTALVPVAIGGTLLAEPLVAPDPSRGLRWSGIAAGPGNLAGTSLDPGVSVPDDAHRARTVRRWAFAHWCWRPWESGRWWPVSGSSFGLPGAATAVLLLGLGLVLAGYGSLRREGRQPAWHHHLARPMAASLVMAPVCLLLQRWHVMLAVLGGALTYGVVLLSLGGLHRTRLWRSAFRPPRA